jgi:hypothetical protein
MFVMDGNFSLGCEPGKDYPLSTYISMYARMNRCYNERDSKTNYVRCSIHHFYFNFKSPSLHLSEAAFFLSSVKRYIWRDVSGPFGQWRLMPISHSSNKVSTQCPLPEVWNSEEKEITWKTRPKWKGNTKIIFKERRVIELMIVFRVFTHFVRCFI